MGTLTAQFTVAFRGSHEIHGDWEIPSEGEPTLALFGPSGCGKTTVLRALAGLNRPASGMVRLGTEVWSDTRTGTWVPPQQRRVGLVFQDFLLFPHLTAKQNVMYALRRLPREVREERAAHWMARLGIHTLADRYPRRLSGGEQQRVAMARMLVTEPRLLLLDEPFAALDRPLRRSLRREVRDLVSSLGIPCVLVSHDIDDVLELTSWMVIMDQGQVLQRGETAAVIKDPVTPRVATLLDLPGSVGLAPALSAG